VYGLTKGQHSPTAPKGFVSTTAPNGVQEDPVNPLTLALSAGATFVSRGFAGDIESLKNILVRAIRYKGFSFVDVLQPCVTFNHVSTYDWYRKNVYHLQSVKHDESDFSQAWQRAREPMDKKIPLGVFYDVARPTLEEHQPAIQQKTLLDQRPSRIVKVSELLRQYQ
jgi:2-oxoglutarate ferredoxin oxidoreductase subunit beta